MGSWLLKIRFETSVVLLQLLFNKDHL